MAKVTAELIEPLDGMAIGSLIDLDEGDFERLEVSGSVKRAGAKQAAAPKNKMAPAPINKLAPAAPVKRRGA